MNLHVPERSCPTGLFHRADEVLGTLKGNNFASSPDDFGKIDGRVARAGTYVENVFANRDTGSLPAIQNYRTPDTMLQPESR
jgi:hypothetical protein